MSDFERYLTEKAILLTAKRQRKQLGTTAKQIEPAKYPNPVKKEVIGRYRPLNSRMYITADVKIIKQYSKPGHKPRRPPSFLEAGPRAKLYFSPTELKKMRVGIVTPGGIAPGINTVIYCIADMHQTYYGTRSVLGFHGGFHGLAADKPERLTSSETSSWIHRGGSLLGSGRGAPKVSDMVQSLLDKGISILYVIGGDGSLSAAHDIAQQIEKDDARVGSRRIVIAGIPRTMDNDILWVWRSFGFDSAVEEATRLINAIHEDTRSTNRVCLVQLFGRQAGFVAAHAFLASGLADVVLIPESPFRIEAVLEYVQTKLVEEDHALVVAGEGAAAVEYDEEYIHDILAKEGFDRNDSSYRADPRVAERLRNGRFEFLVREFKKRFEKGYQEDAPDAKPLFHQGRHRVFVSEPRHLIRAIPANSADQTYCRRLADLAVHSAVAGFTDFMISQWLTEYVLVPLKLVAEQRGSDGSRLTKRIPPRGIFWTTVLNNTGQPSFE